MVERLHKLGDQVGDDHDLAVLRVKLAGQPALLANEASQRGQRTD
jgi:hypothetical protein